MTEHEFTLADRIAKIKSINEKFDLENSAYISFSGGRDSAIVHYLFDLALPGNRIPRVFANTGLEFNDILSYVRELAKDDDRFVILNQKRNIKATLEEYGYPFKSKEHGQRVAGFNRGSESPVIMRYARKIPPKYVHTQKFLCPQKLLYQFEERGKYNYSDQCCHKLKKDLLSEWQTANSRRMTITGMRGKEEGYSRALAGCLTRNNTMFHPLIVCSGAWEDWFVESHNVKLCRLYYPPYNFTRTGCVGCPFNVNIQKELDTLQELLPAERKKAEMIFGPVYDEYRRIGYRLRKEGVENKSAVKKS